jgi:hypothetical protein
MTSDSNSTLANEHPKHTQNQETNPQIVNSARHRLRSYSKAPRDQFFSNANFLKHPIHIVLCSRRLIRISIFKNCERIHLLVKQPRICIDDLFLLHLLNGLLWICSQGLRNTPGGEILLRQFRIVLEILLDIPSFTINLLIDFANLINVGFPTKESFDKTSKSVHFYSILEWRFVFDREARF